MSNSRAIVALLSGLAMSGCASIPFVGSDQNSGQISYRLAEPRAVTEEMVAAHDDNSPLAPAPLVRQYSLSRDAFNSTPASADDRDVYSIILEQTIIGRFIGEMALAQPAEVAILANAFEFDGADASTSSSRFYEFPEITGPRQNEDGSNTAAAAGMKLIYFSPDVYLQQPLNFSALPIIPPTRYNGRPIGIQLVVMELDRIPGPVKSLLRELAALGLDSNIANPPPGLGDVALNLGTSFLNGNSNSDDIVFEVRMVLYPRHLAASETGATPVNETATFQPGRYVALRAEDRSEPIDWSRFRLDHNTARLFRENTQAGATGPTLVEHRDDTYMVVNIIRHAQGTPEASYNFQSLAQFENMLEVAAQTDSAQALEAVTGALRERVLQVRSQAWQQSLNNRWNVMQASLRRLETARYPGLDERIDIVQSDRARCKAGPVTGLRTSWVEARLNVRDAAVELVQNYQLALRPETTSAPAPAPQPTPAAEGDQAQPAQGQQPPPAQQPTPPAQPQFSAADQRDFIARIARYAVPKNEELDANFASVDAFVAAYVTGKSGTELADALIGSVQNVPVSFSCDDLEARGWREAVEQAQPAQPTETRPES